MISARGCTIILMFRLLFTYLPTIVGSLILIVLVGSKKEKSPVRSYFIIFSLALIAWQSSVLASNFLTEFTPILWATRIAIISGTVMAVYFLLFSLAFPVNEKINQKFKVGLYSALVLLVIMCLLPVTVNKIIPDQSNAYLVKYGIGYAIDTAFGVSLFISSLWVLVRKKIKMPAIRDQVNFIFIGIAVAVVSNLLINYVFENTVFSNNFDFIGPYTVFLFLLMLAIAIIRHNLFSINSLTARAASYVVVLGFVATIYILLFYIFGVVIFGLQSFTLSQHAFILFTVTISVLITPYLQRRFNKITNKLFFRDNYNSQDVINKVNSTLVNTLNLEKLLADTINVIETEIKVTYLNFYLESKTNKFHTGNSNVKLFNNPKWLDFIIYFTKHHAKAIQISDTTLPDNLISIMGELQIEGAFKMVSGGKNVGILIAGPRKSGKAFTAVDVQFLEIVADEVAITVQNALRFEEIQNFNLTLQAKVDEATRKLRRANDKLKALDESKDDFISMASHQLRTPLTSIKGYISMVLEGDAGKVTPMQHEMLGQAFFSSQRMVYLISDLLNVSRLKTGKFVIDKSKVNLATMVAQELDQLKETAAARQLTLTHDSPKDFPDLMLDETKTRQVIMNFVDNAIYYTPAGGHINVKLIDNPNNVELRVEDDGIGVSVSDQHHLFTKFYRAGNARKARPDGTGLGLFMAKKVIIAEEGTLIFESKEGKGSTFGFVFYKSKAGVPKK